MVQKVAPVLPALDDAFSLAKLPTLPVSATDLSSNQPKKSKHPEWPPLPVRADGTRGHSIEDKSLSIIGFPRASTAIPREHRQTSRQGSIQSLQSTGQTTSSGSTASVAPIRKGSMEFLEDENQRLREELARAQCGNMERLRRPMAAIAGGGFRATGSQRAPSCNCEVLRVKLARLQAELREARSLARGSSLFSEGTASETAGGSRPSTSSPSTPVVSEVACRVPHFLSWPVLRLDQEVQTSPFSPRGPAAHVHTPEHAQVWASRLVAATIETASQTVDSSSRDVAVEAQISAVDAAVQAEAEQLTSSEMGSQTLVRAIADSSTQTVARHKACSSTASQATTVSAEANAQTERCSTSDCATQAGRSLLLAITCASSQTDLVGSAIAKSPSTNESSAQTTCASSARSMSVQTVPCSMVSAATQVVSVACMEKGIQVEDTTQAQKVSKLEATLQSSSKEAEKLRTQLLEQTTQLQRSQDDCQALKQLTQSNAFGQMNITILCPKAECTVNGLKLEMDSWDVQKLRREFEDEVLPRFMKVFVVESSADSLSDTRPEAIQRTMEEFASTFRERLAVMLTAPNASAAVTAAQARSAAKAA